MDDIKVTTQGTVNWVSVAQDGIKWRALVSTVMAFLVPSQRGTLEQLGIFQIPKQDTAPWG
jgi:hypothetical protein